MTRVLKVATLESEVGIMSSVAGRFRGAIWVGWLIAALLFLGVGNPVAYGIAVPASALALALVPGLVPRVVRRIDRSDLWAIVTIYGCVVGLFYLAFQVFTQANVVGLFLCYAAGLLVGVIGPIIYMVWWRGRRLADLGLRLDNLKPTVALGLALASVQFFLTLYGYRLPADPVDWVPLAVMSLMVGFFEAVFFRGFVQTRLAAAFGQRLGVATAAGLYALYHVGYGMNAREMLFLFGLGIVYAIAYACVDNVLVLWPLLLPMGTFFNNLRTGGFDLPWASILGFIDVLGIMFAVLWLARRREHRTTMRHRDNPKVRATAR